jgi:ATP-dependent Clp protease protease subunit
MRESAVVGGGHRAQSTPVPQVARETPRGDWALDIYSRLLDDRIVIVGDPILPDVANVVMAQLLHLEAQDPARDIAVYINAPGGDPTATLAVIDTMTYVSCDVTTFCFGQAVDAAAILLAAGAAGKRIALRHARVLLSQPRAQLQGRSVDVETGARELLRIQQLLIDLLAERTEHDQHRILRDTDRDLVLTATQAREYGIVDHVVDRRSGG